MSYLVPVGSLFLHMGEGRLTLSKYSKKKIHNILTHNNVDPSILPSVQDIFCRIFLSNCWWQKSDIWSQASYRYTILWVAFLDRSDSYFLFADLVDFYSHWTYMRDKKYLGRKEGWTDRGKTVYLSSPFGERWYNKNIFWSK
jgi:hypothetical protein